MKEASERVGTVKDLGMHLDKAVTVIVINRNRSAAIILVKTLNGMFTKASITIVAEILAIVIAQNLTKKRMDLILEMRLRTKEECTVIGDIKDLTPILVAAATLNSVKPRTSLISTSINMKRTPRMVAT
mmetsp:Transcript_31995/g.53954  ORF Transcript_31995/g.53954 Transcript_31995/m.53954 type:complete len:129 (-) Transcript_31995:374-760(-)